MILQVDYATRAAWLNDATSGSCRLPLVTFIRQRPSNFESCEVAFDSIAVRPAPTVTVTLGFVGGEIEVTGFYRRIGDRFTINTSTPPADI